MTNERTQRLFGQFWHGADYNYEQWLDNPEILADDFRLMQLAHCNIMSVGIFSWVMLEPEDGKYTFGWMDRLMDTLAQNGVVAALATPSAAPPAWLGHQYPEVRRVNEQGLRNRHRHRQNFCHTSPVYREKVAAINRQLAERYRDHPALLLWHISNEYGSYPCHCDYCYAGFRDWLKQRYGDLESLNRAWWTTFWSHRYTSWEQIEPVDSSIQGLLIDWQRFVSDLAIDFYCAEIEPLREITPNIPITTNFMKPDVGLNYWKFAKHLDVTSWDSYPRWHQTDDVLTALEVGFYHDLQRSYKPGQPYLLMESTPSVTNWQGISRLKHPNAHQVTSLQAIAHGSNSVQYFQWRQSRGGEEKFHGAVVSHLGGENTRVFRDVATLGKTLTQITEIADSRVQADVAVLYDFENGWAINHAKLPRNEDKNYKESCIRHYGEFWKQGISVDIIPEEADFTSYRIVIAPMLYMLRGDIAERIEAYVKAGGIFITTYLAGMVDESDLCFLNGYPPALRRTLGIVSEELDTLTNEQSGKIAACEGNDLNLSGHYQFHHYAELVHLESAHSLAVYDSEFYAGYPALTVNAHGDGQAYYIAARMDDAFLTAFYSALIERHSLDANLPVDVIDGISVQTRETADTRYLFVMNFTCEEKVVAVNAACTDVLTQAAVNPSITLPAYGSAILKQVKSG